MKNKTEMDFQFMLLFLPKRSARGGDDNNVFRWVYPRIKYSLSLYLSILKIRLKQKEEKRNWYIDHSLFNHVDHDLNRTENNLNNELTE